MLENQRQWLSNLVTQIETWEGKDPDILEIVKGKIEELKDRLNENKGS